MSLIEKPTLVVQNGVIIYRGSGTVVPIKFGTFMAKIGCHDISDEAMNLLVSKWIEFRKRDEVTIQ